jgi:hypothetical protein
LRAVLRSLPVASADVDKKGFLGTGVG